MKPNTKILPFLFVIFCFAAFNVAAQQPKKQKPRTLTPASYEPQVISRAEDTAEEENVPPIKIKNGVAVEVENPSSAVSSGAPKTTPSNSEQTRRTVEQLAAQVTELSNKITTMETQQRSLLDLERLSRAEQRADALRKQLDDIIDKQGSLQTRLSQIEFDAKPENIERSTAIIGSLRPEELRDQRAKALAAEKTRLQAQLAQANDSQNRLGNSIKSADDLVDKLRQKVEADVDAESVPPVAAPKTTKAATDSSNENGNN